MIRRAGVADAGGRGTGILHRGGADSIPIRQEYCLHGRGEDAPRAGSAGGYDWRSHAGLPSASARGGVWIYIPIRQTVSLAGAMSWAAAGLKGWRCTGARACFAVLRTVRCAVEGAHPLTSRARNQEPEPVTPACLACSSGAALFYTRASIKPLSRNFIAMDSCVDSILRAGVSVAGG